MKRGVLRGKNLVEALIRAGSGHTQESLAQSIGVDRSVISRLENGANVPDELLLTIIDVCGGLRLIDMLIDQLRAAHDWYVSRQRVGPLLYA